MVVFKELIFKELILTLSTLGRCGVAFKELSFNKFLLLATTFGGCGGLQRTFKQFVLLWGGCSGLWSQSSKN